MIHLGHVLCENPGTVLSFKLFAVFALRALIDRWLVPYDPLTTTSLRALEAQSGDRWFGTDRFGATSSAERSWQRGWTRRFRC